MGVGGVAIIGVPIVTIPSKSFGDCEVNDAI
jgi:hypothetical protein